MRRSSMAVGVLVAVLSSACGSTVQNRGTLAGQPDGQLQLPSSSSSDLPDVGLPDGTTPQAGTGETSTDVAGLPTSQGQQPTTSTDTTTTAQSPTVKVNGVTKGEVQIGYSVSTALSGVAGSLGLAGVDAGDTDGQVAAVVKDLNARGGLLGHKIVLKRYDVKADSTPQSECAYWTQDNHVFAVVDAVNVGAPAANEQLAACLNKQRVPLLTGAPLVSQLAYDRFPYLVQPGHAASERYMRGLVEQLAGTDFFHGWNTTLGDPGPQPVRIGIQSFDNPGDQSRANALKKALESRGYTVSEVEKHSTESLASSTQSAVLRFKAAGVTHVFSANVLFYQSAQSQGYHPRYAVDDTANTVQLLAQNAPKAQLHGSRGAGYLPMSEDDTYTLSNPAAKRCLALMKKSGQDISKRFAVTYMVNICDRFAVLERALAASQLLTPTGFLNGLSKLPASIDSAATYDISLTRQRRDGAHRLRGFAYVDSCSCFRLTATKSSF